MPEFALLGAYLESNETRFGKREIRALDDIAAYPLAPCNSRLTTRHIIRESPSLGEKRKSRARHRSGTRRTRLDARSRSLSGAQ